MKKILFLALGVVLLGATSCSNPLKGKFVNKILGGSSEEVEEVEEVEEEEESAPEIEITNYSLNKTVDCDGIDCNFSFNIDWPTEGPAEVTDKVKSWIISSTLGRAGSFDSPFELEQAIIQSDRNEGYIGKQVYVKINVDDSAIHVATTVSWDLGFSIHSPRGTTIRKASFDISNGDLISENVQRQGDDIY